MSWISRPLHNASHAYLEKYIDIKLRGIPTKSSAEWGEFLRLSTLTFWGRCVLICRYILNYYMANSCFWPPSFFSVDMYYTHHSFLCPIFRSYTPRLSMCIKSKSMLYTYVSMCIRSKSMSCAKVFNVC